MFTFNNFLGKVLAALPNEFTSQFKLQFKMPRERKCLSQNIWNNNSSSEYAYLHAYIARLIIAKEDKIKYAENKEELLVVMEASWDDYMKLLSLKICTVLMTFFFREGKDISWDLFHLR